MVRKPFKALLVLLKDMCPGAKGMALWSGLVKSLLEDLSSVPSTQTGWLTPPVIPAPGDRMPPWACAQTSPPTTHIHIK